MRRSKVWRASHYSSLNGATLVAINDGLLTIMCARIVKQNVLLAKKELCATVVTITEGASRTFTGRWVKLGRRVDKQGRPAAKTCVA